MFRLLKASSGKLCDNSSRRDFLQIGSLGIIGLSLPTLLRIEEAKAASKTTADGKPIGALTPKAKSCIIIFLSGGPSHLDMWDMKPQAPAEIRGEFKPIQTTVPGIQVSDQLPRLAKLAHHYSLIRSAYHSVVNAHAAAVYLALTGDDRGDANIAIGASPKDHPSIGSILTYLRPPERPILPYICLPYVTKEGAGGPPQPGSYGGILGSQYDPFFVLNNPNSPNFSVPDITLASGITERRLNARRQLLAEINRRLKAIEDVRLLKGMDGFQQRAFSLLTSSATRQAFDLSQEPDKVRDAYGRNIYGQSGLLARRLIEAGARMVVLHWAPDANATWDTHGGNFVRLKNELLPQLDACVSSLLSDLSERGLLEETLVVCMGEFGRTPKVNNAAGRDHWPYCYSLMLAGGGIKGGVVLGESDEQGGYPVENPVTPQDIVATIYHLLGIPPDMELHDQLARPFVLVREGRVLHQLIV